MKKSEKKLSIEGKLLTFRHVFDVSGMLWTGGHDARVHILFIVIFFSPVFCDFSTSG
ncbi:MAG: hypothetical protein LBR26_09285 [Prevotella sp.]|nr:hypothetical protein [Prevotella sp.]